MPPNINSAAILRSLNDAIFSTMKSILAFCLLASSSSSLSTADRRILVTGAGGQTGQLAFRALLAKPGFYPIGTTRTDDSKKALIEGDVPEENVVVLDITDMDSVEENMEGCDAVLICTSAKPAPTGEVDESTGRPKFGFPLGQPELVDWEGQRNLIDAAKKTNPGMHVVLCSSMGGTNPNNPLNNLGKTQAADGKTTGGDILKWKRKAEKYLIDSKLPYTIVHPGGLLNEPGGERELCVGVDDVIPGTSNNSLPRADVASVMIASLEDDKYRGRSFDVVSKPVGEGQVTTDFSKLVDSLGGKNCDYSLGEIA